MLTKIIATTALTVILVVNTAGTPQAEELSSAQTMKPVHAITFDVGTRRAASYFISDNGTCKLVLTLAEAPNWDELSTFTSTRFEAVIPAGRVTRFHSNEGKALELACQAGAESMSIKPVSQVAGGSIN